MGNTTRLHDAAHASRVPRRKQEDRWAMVPAGVGGQVAKHHEELSVLESGLYSPTVGLPGSTFIPGI